MTWGKALPVIIVAVVFDALRFMFEWFIIFGPAIAAAACTAIGSSYVGTTISGVVCASGAAVGGFFGAAFIGPFGIVMAMATGLAGWLTIFIILMIFNERIFKENALWFAGSLLISEVPFVGSIPALSVVLWRMYHVQIKVEKAALKKFEKEQVDAQLEERRQQAANDAVYAEAANDEEIPEDLREAA